MQVGHQLKVELTKKPRETSNPHFTRGKEEFSRYLNQGHTGIFQQILFTVGSTKYRFLLQQYSMNVFKLSVFLEEIMTVLGFV